MIQTAAGETLAVEIDPRHLRQIMSNLCENALKYAAVTPQEVRIEIHARLDPSGSYTMTEVRDNGPGIDSAAVRELFNPFFSTSPSGTGLGLYTAKELSRINGVELEYIARDGPGTCFRLSFPA